jgi:hypothetical protein
MVQITMETFRKVFLIQSKGWWITAQHTAHAGTYYTKVTTNSRQFKLVGRTSHILANERETKDCSQKRSYHNTAKASKKKLGAELVIREKKSPKTKTESTLGEYRITGIMLCANFAVLPGQ